MWFSTHALKKDYWKTGPLTLNKHLLENLKRDTLSQFLFSWKIQNKQARKMNRKRTINQMWRKKRKEWRWVMTLKVTLRIDIYVADQEQYWKGISNPDHQNWSIDNEWLSRSFLQNWHIDNEWLSRSFHQNWCIDNEWLSRSFHQIGT